MKIVPDSDLPQLIWKLGMYGWVLSPFSYFGTGIISTIFSSIGYGLLIAVWWFCFGAFSAVLNHPTVDYTGQIVQIVVQAMFLITGLSSMFTIQRVFRVVLNRLEGIDKGLYQAIQSTVGIRTVLTFAGIVVGGVVFLLCRSITITG